MEEVFLLQVGRMTKELLLLLQQLLLMAILLMVGKEVTLLMLY